MCKACKSLFQFLNWFSAPNSYILQTKVYHTAKRLKTRFAPTPSGYLHLGNALSFAITWALARQQNGLILLRIDDLDTDRFRTEYLQDIFDTLHFLGLDWDEGPVDGDDYTRNYTQHTRLKTYQALLDVLVSKGLAYACTCSRKEFADGLHSKECSEKKLPLTTPEAAWRIRLPESLIINVHDLRWGACKVHLTDTMPDFVLRGKNELPAYQVASLCDDIYYGINTIVRGQDLLPSTAAQTFLATQAGLHYQVAFLHHPLAYEAAGTKLSKSHGSLSICEMRKAGATTKDIWNMIARLAGWHHVDITCAKDFLHYFRVDLLPGQLSSVPQLSRGTIY